jgi:citrate synthase
LPIKIDDLSKRDQYKSMIAHKTPNPGLENVVAAETTLSSIDGESGNLIIFGYHLAQLAPLNYDDVYREMLTTTQPLGPLRSLAFQRLRPVLGILPTLQPMRAVRLALASLPDEATTEELVAAFPVILAAAKQGPDLLEPNPELSQADDLTRLFFGRVIDRELSQALNTYLVTVCEHGMNASTFACRVVTSTGANPVSAAMAALGALSGPLHGGAPGPVLDMLDSLRESDDIAKDIRLRLKGGERLMGFGHRVYRARDPRATVLKQALSNLAKTERLDHADKVESLALKALQEFKPGRPLKTNVEFYTAVLLNEIGFDRAWFTSLFATGRILGWMAHYKEQQETGRLIRPKSIYVGRDPGPRLETGAN